MVTGCVSLLLLVRAAAAQDLVIPLSKAHRGLKLSAATRTRCGLSAAGPAFAESGPLAAPFPFSSVSASWISDTAGEAFAIRVRVSQDKKTWSLWTTVSGLEAIRETGENRTVGKPVPAGRAGYVEFRVDWTGPACLKEISFSFLGADEIPDAIKPR